MKIELSPVCNGLYWDVEFLVEGRKYAEAYTHASSEHEAITQAEALLDHDDGSWVECVRCGTLLRVTDWDQEMEPEPICAACVEEMADE